MRGSAFRSNNRTQVEFAVGIGSTAFWKSKQLSTNCEFWFVYHKYLRQNKLSILFWMLLLILWRVASNSIFNLLEKLLAIVASSFFILFDLLLFLKLIVALVWSLVFYELYRLAQFAIYIFHILTVLFGPPHWILEWQ